MVGAAILLDDGTIVRGSNVENAASLRVAVQRRLFSLPHYIKLSRKEIVVIAIAALSVGGKQTGEPVPPCGMLLGDAR